ncbi:MAG TPA: hypothetical protein VIC35_00940 [Acidimicrobiia bacterium]|jgi:hypothetical protein
MRRSYACRLELADVSGRDPLTARAVAKQWVGRQYGGWPHDAEDTWHPAPGVTIRWRLLHDPERDDEAFELTWTHPYERDETLWCTTTIQISTTGGTDGTVLLIEQLDASDARVSEGPRLRTQRPEVVREIVQSVGCVDGGWTLDAAPRRVAADRAMELDAFVRGDRRLPVVLVAADRQSRVRADADRFADDLVGLAHVVVLPDEESVTAVDRELGSGRGAPAGGVRLLWPSWRSSDPPARHPRWAAEDVAGPEGPRPRVAEALLDRVVDAATLHIEPIPDVDRLVRRRAETEQHERRADLEKLRRAVEDDRAAAEELIGEYQTELSLADENVRDLETRLEQERTARLRAEEAYLWVASQGLADRGPEVPSLLAAVRLAAASLPHLVVLPEAERSARAWQFDRAGLVLDDLRKLDAVAGDWAAGTLRGDFATACRERGLDWVRGISESAEGKHSSEYLRTYDGRTIQLGPHLRRGGRQLLRIYCYLDERAHRVVIGHVGGHLSDRTT